MPLRISAWSFGLKSCRQGLVCFPLGLGDLGTALHDQLQSFRAALGVGLSASAGFHRIASSATAVSVKVRLIDQELTRWHRFLSPPHQFQLFLRQARAWLHLVQQPFCRRFCKRRLPRVSSDGAAQSWFARFLQHCRQSSPLNGHDAEHSLPMEPSVDETCCF